MSLLDLFFKHNGDRISTILSLFHHSENSQEYTAKIHDYSNRESEVDYIFESAHEGLKGYLTAQDRGVKVGDRVILVQENDRNYYQVENIDYYSNPSDMYIALLRKLSTKLD